MSALEEGHPTVEEWTPEGLTNRKLEEQLRQQLDECNHNLRVQDLEAAQLRDEQDEARGVPDVVAQLIKTSSEHCARLEEIRSVTIEIYLSNRLNLAHSILLSGLLPGSDIEEHCKDANDILKDVNKAASHGRLENVISTQTWAKVLYVNGVSAEMMNKLEDAKRLYNQAVSCDPHYQDLKRVGRFFDPNLHLAKVTPGRDASLDCGLGKRRSTLLQTSDSGKRGSWLFEKLNLHTTSSDSTIDPIDGLQIKQVFQDKSGSSRTTCHNASPSRVMGNRGRLRIVDSPQARPLSPSPHESRTRHSAPSERSVSFGNDPKLVDELSTLSDTPQPSELARPPKPPREENMRRTQLRPIDTSSARGTELAKGSASPPHPPSPLRMVSVNRSAPENDDSGKAREEASKLP